MAKNYLSLAQQKKLLQEKKFKELLEYSRAHHLCKEVGQELVETVMRLSDNSRTESVH